MSLIFLVINKTNMMNMELTEDNDFGLNLPERPIVNQGNSLFK